MHKEDIHDFIYAYEIVMLKNDNVEKLKIQSRILGRKHMQSFKTISITWLFAYCKGGASCMRN